MVLCAPTGKAARNLTKRTGLPARTVHSALGMHPDEDFLAPVTWNTTELVVVAEALLHNVVDFTKLHRKPDLAFDASFCLHKMREKEIREAVTEEAVRRFVYGESVQALSPYNRLGELSVYSLNKAIRDRVNPLEPGKLVLKRGKDSFRDGGRVIILQNDRERNCSNGDVGILHVLRADEKQVAYCVELPDGRCPAWDDTSGLAQLSLAYCLTVHKSQGSEYDTVLFPMAKGMDGMLSRNLLYTAISRAKRRIILYGDPQALDVAVQKNLPQRKSLLVPKTRMLLECA